MRQILGSNPITSFSGYLVAGLMVAQTLMDAGEINPWKITIAVSIAILGRVAGDSSNTKR